MSYMEHEERRKEARKNLVWAVVGDFSERYKKSAMMQEDPEHAHDIFTQMWETETSALEGSTQDCWGILLDRFPELEK